VCIIAYGRVTESIATLSSPDPVLRRGHVISHAYNSLNSSPVDIYPPRSVVSHETTLVVRLQALDVDFVPLTRLDIFHASILLLLLTSNDRTCIVSYNPSSYLSACAGKERQSYAITSKQVCSIVFS
jgi:hypothetical protein